MDRAAKASKTAVPATPALRPPQAAPRPTAAAALQSRIGASGVHKLVASRAKAPAAGHSDAKAPPANDAHAATAHPAARGQAAHKKHQALAADGKEKSPAAAESADAEAGGGTVAAEAGVKLHMPEPPTKPSRATMGRIAGVKARGGSTAVAQGTLPDAASQVGDAHAAVAPPSAELLAEARAKLIAQVHAEPSPDIVKLCEHIRQVIRDKRPKDDDALTEADPTAAANEAGATLNANISSESQKVETSYGALKGTATPEPAPGAPPLTPQPGAAATPPLNAKSATPDAVPAGNVSLDKDAEDARKRADAAGMNKPAAALVQSGPVAEAREAQGELDDVAKADPGKVLAQQKEALAKADADMGALQLRALAALTGARAGTSGQATDHKKAMVGSEAQMREQAGAEAAAAIGGTQALVRPMLETVVPTAMEKWEAAKQALTTKFKQDLAAVEADIKERHSGAGGKLLAVADWVSGLPDWVIRDYDKAEQHFADGVVDALKSISTYVNSIIKACETLIQQTRDRLDVIYGALPPSLKKWADDEKAKFNGQLDALGKEVHATQESFNKDLAGRAGQAVDEVREQIAALRLKAGGLVGRIVAAVQRFIDDPVKFIVEGLLELLGISPPAFWAVVAKIKKVVRDIIDDPMGFANNLMAGIGQGFSQFFDNFGTHMIRGFLSWLLGDLKDVQIPKELSLKSIVTFFLQIMGITWPNIRKIIAKKIGEKNVALIEKVWSLVSVLIEKGPQGIFEMIEQALDPQAIVDQVIQMAVDYMVTAIAKQVAVRIALLFNPAGAILQAIEAIYRVLKWVFQNAARIFTLIETIVNGLADIIAGNVGGFANAVEKGLEMLIAPVLGFIADYFSLGDLPKMVAKQIKGFRVWILGKIEAGFDWVIEKGKALLAKMGIGGKKDKDKKQEPSAGTVGEDIEFEAEGEQHHLWIEVHGTQPKVMLASQTMQLSAFLSSQAVRRAAESNKDVKRALGDVTKNHGDVINAAVKQLKQTAKTADGGAGSGAPPAGDGTVTKEEKELAAAVKVILEAMAKQKSRQPFAGIHGIIKQVSGEKERESHHVPARAFGKATSAMFTNVAAGLTREPWNENEAAVDLKEQLRARARETMDLAQGEADELSAISLSYECHKGDEGAHSTDSAEILAELARAKGAGAIPAVKKATLDSVHKTFISVNPRTGAWKLWLGDIYRQVMSQPLSMDPKDPRDNKQAAMLILSDARAKFEELEEIDKKFIATEFTGKVNRVIEKAAPSAFKAGSRVVAGAMDKTGEGDAKDQKAALADLKSAYETSWVPFFRPF